MCSPKIVAGSSCPFRLWSLLGKSVGLVSTGLGMGASKGVWVRCNPESERQWQPIWDHDHDLVPVTGQAIGTAGVFTGCDSSFDEFVTVVETSSASRSFLSSAARCCSCFTVTSMAQV